MKSTNHNKSLVNTVVTENLDYLVRFALFKVQDKDIAEDLVYDAVLKFLERDLSQINESKMRAYLYRIVYNLCSDYLLMGKNIETLDSMSNCYDLAVHTDNELIEKEEVDRINQLLENLSSKESDVIRMRVVEELSFVEISDILNTPVSTIKSRYKMAMEKLRYQFNKSI